MVYAEPRPGVSQDLPPESSEAKARQALEKLLDATSRDEIAKVVHDPADTFLRYANTPVTATPRKRILFDASEKIPQSTQKYHLFRVVTDDVPLGFPVAIEDTDSGPRIDYSAFLQCRDQLLDKFMAEPSATPGQFLVTLRRGHYFGNEISQTGLDLLICFEIASPNPSSPRHIVFIPRSQELGKLALNKYSWDHLYTPVLELSHKGNLVHVTNILGDTWQKPRRPATKPAR